jgi:segregation and condensation protein B
MSSRKKKREKRAQAKGASDASAPEAQAAEAELADDAVDETGEPVAEAEPVELDDAAEQPEAPAVSEISELKPRRKRKRAAEEEAEPEPEAAGASELEDDDEEEEGFADDAAKEAPKTRTQLKRVLESLIFVSDHVITAQQLGRITKAKIGDVREALAELTVDYGERGIDLVEVNGGYQFRSAAASAPYVRVLVAARPVRLTRAQLETLALIAYRQPITRPEVDDVRGVDSGSAIKVLLERELIKILGRKDDAGRPLLYGTTPFFLEFFGMNTMQELPTLREFTELSDEHRELFQRKTNEIGDLSAEAELPFTAARGSDSEHEEQVEAEAELAEIETEPEPQTEAAEVVDADQPIDVETVDEPAAEDMLAPGHDSPDDDVEPA